MDGTIINSCADRFWWLWTNVASLKILQNAYWFILKSPTWLEDDSLDRKQHSFIVQHDDQPPLVMVNKVGLPWASLPTFLSFSRCPTFWDGSPWMIWDTNSSKMKELNANER